MADSYIISDEPTPKEIFIAMAKINEKEEKLPNLFTYDALHRYIREGAQGNFYEVITSIIEENRDILSTLVNALKTYEDLSSIPESKMELSQVGDSVRASFDRGIVEIKKDFKSVVIANLYYDMLKRFSEMDGPVAGEFLESFAKPQGFKSAINKLEIKIGDKKAAEKKDKAKATNEDIESMKELIDESSVSQLEYFFSKYVDEAVRIDPEEKRNFAARLHAKTIATSFGDLKNGYKFPMEDYKERFKRQKELWGPVERINRLVSQSPYLEEVEFDMKDSKDKQGSLEYLEETIEDINESEMPIGKRVVLRLRHIQNRTIGGHGVLGMCRPGTEKEPDQIVVEVGKGGSTSIINLFATLADIHALKGVKVRDDIVRYFSKKVSYKLFHPRYAEHIRKPSNVAGAICELGRYLLDMDRGKSISLIKSKEAYELSSKRYFDFLNWTEEEKQMAMDFYKMFFNGKISPEDKVEIEERLKENLGRGFKRAEESNRAKEEPKTARARLTEEEEALQTLKKLLQTLNPMVAEMILAELHKREEFGEDAPLTSKEFVLKSVEYAKRNMLSPWNASSNVSKGIFTDTFQNRMKFNKDYFRRIAKKVLDLSPETRKSILSDQEIADGLDRPMSQISIWNSDFAIKDYKSDGHKSTNRSGLFYFLTEEEVKEYAFNEPQEFLDVYAQMLDAAVKRAKMKKINKFTVDVYKGRQYRFDREEIKEVISQVYTTKDEFISSFEAYGTRSFYERVTKESGSDAEALEHIVDSLHEKNERGVHQLNVSKDYFLGYDDSVFIPQMFKDNLQQVLMVDGIEVPAGMKENLVRGIELSDVERIKPILDDDVRGMLKEKRRYLLTEKIPMLKSAAMSISSDSDMAKRMVKSFGEDAKVEDIPELEPMLEVLEAIDKMQEKVRLMGLLAENIKELQKKEDEEQEKISKGEKNPKFGLRYKEFPDGSGAMVTQKISGQEEIDELQTELEDALNGEFSIDGFIESVKSRTRDADIVETLETMIETYKLPEFRDRIDFLIETGNLSGLGQFYRETMGGFVGNYVKKLAKTSLKGPSLR